MLKLEPSAIRLQAQPANKEEAIRQAGRLLVDAGYIEASYIESMLGREYEANTHLGNGIAIPHGMLQDKEKIIRTGISVLQVPHTVEWNPGEPVHLVVGIAARSDEHIEILADLMDVLSDEATVLRLAQTDNPAEIVACLTRTQNGVGTDPAPTVEQTSASGKRIRVTVQGHAGLHARPATNFVDIAKQFQADVQVAYAGKTANGKSLAALLRLGAGSGALIDIIANGVDEDTALQTLKEAVEHGLGDAEDQPERANAIVADYTWMPESDGQMISGVAASPGLAIGPIYQLKQRNILVEKTASDSAAEEMRLKQAIETANAQLEDLYNQVTERSGAYKASIFRAHAGFLADPDLLNEVLARIRSGVRAGWAWSQVVETRVADMKQLDDTLLAGRAVDLHDVGQRVLRLLDDTTESDQHWPDMPVIIIAEDLTPSDTASLDPKRVLGFCTASGGPTSHTAIIARSLDIPAIVGAGPVVVHLTNDTLCILDGNSGNLYSEPTEADVASAEAPVRRSGRGMMQRNKRAMNPPSRQMATELRSLPTLAGSPRRPR